MNILSKKKFDLLVAGILAGDSDRRIMLNTSISTNTIRGWRPKILALLPAILCKCGEDPSHPGSCRYRFEERQARRKLMLQPRHKKPPTTKEKIKLPNGLYQHFKNPGGSTETERLRLELRELLEEKI